MSEIQYELFEATLAQKFETWKALPGAGDLLREAYRLTAPYGMRYVRTGVPVGIGLIWEELRDRCRTARRRRKEWTGYTCNNDWRAYLARHMMQHRPEWAGLFQVRAVGKPKQRKRRVLVIEEKGRAQR